MPKNRRASDEVLAVEPGVKAGGRQVLCEAAGRFRKWAMVFRRPSSSERRGSQPSRRFAYELERKTWRPLVMALKDRRRIRAGGHLTFLFENRDTVRYQIQEMMRIERIVEPEAIRHELETYNELIPGENELSASLLIEYDSPEERSVRLRELLGLENHVWLVAGGESARARFDTRQIATDRISSVQYIKFRLSPEQAARWREGARLAADHPQYRAEHELTPEEIDELARDLG